MINIYVSQRNQQTVQRLLKTAPEATNSIRIRTYQKTFRRREAFVGTSIFTDFDLLQTYEIDAAAQIADAVQKAHPESRVLNHPATICERYLLLRRLNENGLNPVEITRLEDSITPTRYPVFIRSEDGCAGPESDLIRNDEEFFAAKDTLKRLGRTLKRRVAVSFESCQDDDGYYRKYGAFIIGNHIIPQHILRNQEWNVKSDFSTYDDNFAKEEATYVEENPHEKRLKQVATTSGIEFGRIDYTMVEGTPVIFEINTNPTFPRFKGGEQARQERRDIILGRLKRAFEEIDQNVTGKEVVPFPFKTIGNYGFIEREHWSRDIPKSLMKPSAGRRNSRTFYTN